MPTLREGSPRYAVRRQGRFELTGSSLRPLLVLAHRYVGLALAGFLLVAGLSGSLLAWNSELEELISPSLFKAAPPSPDAVPLDPLSLREKVQADNPGVLVGRVPLTVEPGKAMVFRLQALPHSAKGAPPVLANDQIFVNPYTGDVLGRRKWGDISQGRKNLMPFIYRLHHSLALGKVGSTLLGIVALLWTIDCFVGACLTFPQRRRGKQPIAGRPVPAGRHTGKSWPARWWPAWQVHWRGSAYKMNFQLHRAGGLWPWAMLFVLAWSGVSFNLSEVYDPVMRTLFASQREERAAPLPSPLTTPPVGWAEARRIGQRLMAEQALAGGFAIRREHLISYDPRTGQYHYFAQSDRDLSERWRLTRISFTADSGALTGVWRPVGVAAGDTIRTWITSLHMAALGGMPMKLFIGAMGLVVAMLSVTGVAIWARKRHARFQIRQKPY